MLKIKGYALIKYELITALSYHKQVYKGGLVAHHFIKIISSKNARTEK